MKYLHHEIRRHISNFFYWIRKLFHLPEPVDFKYIDIVFENCNWVRIPSRLIDGLLIRDMRKDVVTNWCQQFITSNYCMEIEIILKIEALKIKTGFQKEFDSNSSYFENHLKVYRDITHVAVKPKKGKLLYVAAPYKTKSTHSTINLLQKIKLKKDTITISIKE